MEIKTSPVTLLRTSHESFKGTDDKNIEYDKAVLLDDEGNKFEMPIDSSAASDIMALGEKVDGVATMSAFVARKANATVIKFRLLDFKPAK